MRNLLVTALVVVAITACGPRGPLQVANVQLGRSLNSDKSVGSHGTRFSPEETVYASVLTAGPGAGTIAARWFYSGRVVSEAEKKVAYHREAATEFHINYAGGAPPGQYRVEILVDGEPVGTREFRVEK